MATKKIKATPTELAKLTHKIAAAKKAKQEFERANTDVVDMFTMFAEGRGVSGASLVAIEGGHVVVSVPETPAADPPAALEEVPGKTT